MNIEENIPMADPEYEMEVDARLREPPPLSMPEESEFEMEREAFAKAYIAENPKDNCRNCNLYGASECYLSLYGHCNRAGLFIHVNDEGNFFVEKQGGQA